MMMETLSLSDVSVCAACSALSCAAGQYLKECIGELVGNCAAYAAGSYSTSLGKASIIVLTSQLSCHLGHDTCQVIT